jgi:hypothetical protein
MMTTEAFDALLAAAEAEFVRLYPRRSTSTLTACHEIARIARRMKMRGPA